MARSVNTAIDSLNFFVESRNTGNIILSSATVSAAGNSGDLINTNQQGAQFFITIASVSVTSATIQLAINAKDVSTSTYFPYIKVSVDGMSAAAGQGMVTLYVGAVSAFGLSTAVPNLLIGLPLPNVFQVVTSMTIASTTATNSGTASLRIDYSKIM